MKRDGKVLLAEDSELQADMLESMLEESGLKQVSKVDNGRRAVDLFQSALQNGDRYSLVFLDIVMPEMDGQEALRRIRDLEKAHGIHVPERSVIIMTTALGSPQDMMDALLDGDCDDYIVKPVEEGDLQAMLTKYNFA